MERALSDLLESGEDFDYARVVSLVEPRRPSRPAVKIPAPDLRSYDRLLAMGGAR